MLETLTCRLQQEWDAVEYRAERPTAIQYLGIPGSVEGATMTMLGFFNGQGKPSVVIKIHRDPEETDFAENERTVLQTLRSRGEFFRSSVPQVFFTGRVGRFRVIAESALEGGPMMAVLDGSGLPELGSARRNMDLAMGWLIECHRSAGVPSGTSDWPHIALPLIGEFQKVFDLSPDEQAHLDDLCATIERLSVYHVPLCIRHGDFCRHNLLLSGQDGSARVGVIDWTFSRLKALPLHDLVFFLATYCLQARKALGVQSLDAMFEYTFLDRNDYSRLIGGYLARYCRALEIEPALLPVLFEICMIEQALFEYRRVVTVMKRGNLPRFSLFLAASEGRGYNEAPKAQLWVRFFKVFARQPWRLAI